MLLYLFFGVRDSYPPEIEAGQAAVGLDFGVGWLLLVYLSEIESMYNGIKRIEIEIF